MIRNYLPIFIALSIILSLIFYSAMTTSGGASSTPKLISTESLTLSNFSCEDNSIRFVLCNYNYYGTEFYIKLYTDLYDATKSFSVDNSSCSQVKLNIPKTNFINKIDIIPKGNFCNNTFSFEVEAKC